MSDKKVTLTIVSGCRADGRSLERGKVYELPLADAKLIVSAGRAIYGGTLPAPKKKAVKKATTLSQPAA